MASKVKKHYCWMPYDAKNNEYWPCWAQETEEDLFASMIGCSTQLDVVRVEIKPIRKVKRGKK